MMLPKPHRVRDRKAIEAARKPWCEVCGKPGTVQVHHITSRGAFGPDEESNLISLCISCHTKAHNLEISKERLREIVRRRDE